MKLCGFFVVFSVFLTVKTVLGFINADHQTSETHFDGIYRRSVTSNTTEGTPWQVCVNFLGNDAFIPQKCYCGGILISQKWVLSGAHCFRSNDVYRPWRKSQFQFVLGMTAGRKRQVLKAKNIILHEGYRPNENRCVPGDDDIALIELEQSVKTDTQHVKVLQLPEANANFDGMSCSVGDWDGSTGTDLSQEAVSIPSDAGVCQINSNTGQSKVFKGESGGAIVCGQDKKVAAGVVQFGTGCRTSGKFIPINRYLNWIGQNTGLFPVNTAHGRKRRMYSGSDCFTAEYFPNLRKATIRFMYECFKVQHEEVAFRDLEQPERDIINKFIGKFSGGTSANKIVYNVRNLRDILNLIFEFGRGGLSSMPGILANDIIIRQIEDEEFRNGFLITANNFYVFPYRVNRNNLQTADITDGSYQNIYRRLEKDVKQFNGYAQIRAFAGIHYYREPNSMHFAHFTFANLFAESVRNWNSLTIAISFLNQYRSTISLFEDNIWPMIGGSWNNKATWGKNTENTPTDTIKKFEAAMETLNYQNEKINDLYQLLKEQLCDLYDNYNLGEEKPRCC